jgi:hypothetical protein
MTSPAAYRAALLLAGGLILAAQSTLAQPQPPVASGSVSALSESRSVSGRIAEIFGDRFIMESEGRRLLVEPFDARPDAFGGKPDDRVSVDGVGTGAVLRARKVTREDGQVLLDRAAPPAPSDQGASMPAQFSATLQRLGLTPVGVALRKKHHTEIAARMADGRTVFVAFDRAGRLLEIEDATHEREKGREDRAQSPTELDAIARAAGFVPTGERERKKHHVEVIARNQAGELLELHIDRSGYIYKQVWLW